MVDSACVSCCCPRRGGKGDARSKGGALRSARGEQDRARAGPYLDPSLLSAAPVKTPSHDSGPDDTCAETNDNDAAMIPTNKTNDQASNKASERSSVSGMLNPGVHVVEVHVAR